MVRLWCTLQASGSQAWVSVDLGYASCQAWPDQMILAAPFDQSSYPGGNMPTSFRSDAAASGLQPNPSSTTWQLLSYVDGFKPKYPTTSCGTCLGQCIKGVLRHTFPILPRYVDAALLAPGPAPQLPVERLSTPFNVSLADSVWMTYALDTLDNQQLLMPQSRDLPPHCDGRHCQWDAFLRPPAKLAWLLLECHPGRRGD